MHSMLRQTFARLPWFAKTLQQGYATRHLDHAASSPSNGFHLRRRAFGENAPKRPPHPADSVSHVRRPLWYQKLWQRKIGMRQLDAQAQTGHGKAFNDRFATAEDLRSRSRGTYEKAAIGFSGLAKRARGVTSSLAAHLPEFSIPTGRLERLRRAWLERSKWIVAVRMLLGSVGLTAALWEGPLPLLRFLGDERPSIKALYIAPLAGLFLFWPLHTGAALFVYAHALACHSSKPEDHTVARFKRAMARLHGQSAASREGMSSTEAADQGLRGIATVSKMSKASGKALPPELLELVALFQSSGLNEQLSLRYAKDGKVAPSLKSLVERYRLPEKRFEAKQASLVAQLAENGTKLDETNRGHVVDAIGDGRVKTADQLSAALDFLASHPYSAADFDKAAGVGVTISPEQLNNTARALLKEHSASASDPWADYNALFARFRGLESLRWADKPQLKPAFDAVFVEIHGPRPDLKQKGKAESAATKAARAAAAKPQTNGRSTSSAPDMFKEGFLASLHKPGENSQLTPALRDAHLKATEGKVMTRFPPEPNGFLHIGHSRAIAVNFGYARHHKGHCYLRYDDTNPEAEEQKYFDAILEVIRWLGYEPYKITYSSDNFDQLYALAVELIKRDKAYMCFCTPEEIKANRGQIAQDGDGPMTYGARKPCAHRNRPVEDSLADFEKMRDGHYEPGAAVLRMKQNLEDGNPQLWDIIAYRTLKAHHHRTGDKWKIYPTYDFTHCLCDSIENISHSLCTTEFIQSRVSYDWLCNALEVYRPQQREYGRLNIEGTVMSKRKILKLVKEGYVSGWDDPRLYTLIALRRRGIPPGALVAFVNELGVGESAADVSLARFDQAVRSYAERNVPRLSLIVRPLKLVIDGNVSFLDPDDASFASSGAAPTYVTREVLPNSEEMGKVKMPFGKTVYIDQADFRATPSADFQRLVPGGRIGLLGVPAIFTCTSHQTDAATGVTSEITCRYEPVAPGTKPPHKVKYIHWVESEAAVPIDEVRLYGPLFKSAKPDFKSDTWLEELNPHSVEVIKGAVIEPSFWEIASKAFWTARKEAKARGEASAKELVEARDDAPQPSADQLVGNEVIRFQAMREAYFALDKDSTLDLEAKKGRIVLNRFVGLKEDAAKNA